MLGESRRTVASRANCVRQPAWEQCVGRELSPLGRFRCDERAGRGVLDPCCRVRARRCEHPVRAIQLVLDGPKIDRRGTALFPPRQVCRIALLIDRADRGPLGRRGAGRRLDLAAISQGMPRERFEQFHRNQPTESR